VLAGQRGDRSVRDAELAELRKRVGQWERALGRKTYELEVAGSLELRCRDDEAIACVEAAVVSRSAPRVDEGPSRPACPSINGETAPQAHR
jgi:hypothetical protein